MGIVQSFRRLSQHLNGWNNALDGQQYQLKIIRKLYLQNCLQISGGGACPEQYVVFKNSKRIAYYRLRHGLFTVNFINGNTETEILKEEPIGDGLFETSERLIYLTQAMRKVLSEIQKQTT